MEERIFGRTGIRLPVVGLGTYRNLDVYTTHDRDRCRVLVRQALDLGTRFFDSSPMYGASERILGWALGERRNDAFVATKVWTQDDHEAQNQYANALNWFDDQVDLYQVHNLVRWEQRLDELERLRDDGKIRFIGITHWRQVAMSEIVGIIRTGRVDTVQVPYNVLEPDVADEILPLCEEQNIGVVIMVPLAQGELLRQAPPAEALEPLKDFGVDTWAQALLKWVLSDPRVHVIIPATSRLDHLKQNIAAGSPPWFPEKIRQYMADLARRYRRG